ncbi:MAG: hypothetical protein HYT78_11365 [Deltaproteobacteria bacterium]|nr:hypothetical protein [Deltaproteobacteria bacterium]
MVELAVGKEHMEPTGQQKKDDRFEVYDKIDGLRTDYVRELSSLSKIFITISSALLGLTLAPLAPDLFAKIGLTWLVLTWIALAITATLGFVQVFVFSSRFKTRADYLWACHLTDVVVQVDGSNEKIDEFWNKADRFKRRYDRQYRICAALVVAQGLALLVAFGLLATFIWVNFKSKVPL